MIKNEFKVGDKVFSEEMGNGEIIIGNANKHYPILVSFSSGKTKRYTRYTKSGLLYTNRSDQSTDLQHRDEPVQELVDLHLSIYNGEIGIYEYADINNRNYLKSTAIDGHPENIREFENRFNCTVDRLIGTHGYILFERSELSDDFMKDFCVNLKKARKEGKAREEEIKKFVKPDDFSDAVTYFDNSGSLIVSSKPDFLADVVSHIDVDGDGVELIANKRMINDDLKPQPMAIKEVVVPEFETKCVICGTGCNKVKYQGKFLLLCEDCRIWLKMKS